MEAETEKWDKSNFPVSSIQVATENEQLYGPFGIANGDDADLVRSIRKNGIKEPLTLSADHVLLSGHRRLAAAKHLCLDIVPVRVLQDIVFFTLPAQERLEVLRLFNQQREKSPGERIKEKLLDIDPREAHIKLKRLHLETKGKFESNIVMGAAKKRASITTKKFITKVNNVINENRLYWPLTVRRVHYLLLNDPPLKHDKKPDSTYKNDQRSYKILTNLLLRSRLSGDTPMESIEDTTRPIQLGSGYSTFEEFVGQQTKYFLSGYSRNLMQGQPNHIEIMLEKNALRSVIEQVARQYCIACTTVRGFSSLSPRYEMAQRFKQSGKACLVLLMLTDFDPDGEEIANTFAKSLRDDFNIQEFRPIKVALTADDVKKHALPSDMNAKVSSPNHKKFFMKYGTKRVVELDAAPVTLLQSKLIEAINSVIDMDEFNAQKELEIQDSAHIEAHRQVVFEAIKGNRPAI